MISSCKQAKLNIVYCEESSISYNLVPIVPIINIISLKNDIKSLDVTLVADD